MRWTSSRLAFCCESAFFLPVPLERPGSLTGGFQFTLPHIKIFAAGSLLKLFGHFGLGAQKQALHWRASDELGARFDWRLRRAFSVCKAACSQGSSRLLPVLRRTYRVLQSPCAASRICFAEAPLRPPRFRDEPAAAHVLPSSTRIDSARCRASSLTFSRSSASPSL